jgi:hypothetical protein
MGTQLMIILLSGLFILFVLALLAALVYSIYRLISTPGDGASATQKQQRFLAASVANFLSQLGGN